MDIVCVDQDGIMGVADIVFHNIQQSHFMPDSNLQILLSNREVHKNDCKANDYNAYSYVYIE